MPKRVATTVKVDTVIVKLIGEVRTELLRRGLPNAIAESGMKLEDVSSFADSHAFYITFALKTTLAKLRGS